MAIRYTFENEVGPIIKGGPIGAKFSKKTAGIRGLIEKPVIVQLDEGACAWVFWQAMNNTDDSPSGQLEELTIIELDEKSYALLFRRAAVNTDNMSPEQLTHDSHRGAAIAYHTIRDAKVRDGIAPDPLEDIPDYRA